MFVCFHQATSLLPEPWPPHTYVLCSNKAPQETSSSVQPATVQPCIQLHASPAAAAALATSLAGIDKGHSWPGYQLLGQLALADIQDGSERVTGIAQHLMSCTLKVGSNYLHAKNVHTCFCCFCHVPYTCWISRCVCAKHNALQCTVLLKPVFVSCNGQSILGSSQTAMMHAADRKACRINQVWW